MSFSLLLTVGTATCAAAFRNADMVPTHMRGGSWYRSALALDAADDAALGRLPEAYEALAFKQLIWHNDSSKGTFSQNYYQDLTNATSGLCLLSIGGEGPTGGPPGWSRPALTRSPLQVVSWGYTHSTHLTSPQAATPRSSGISWALLSTALSTAITARVYLLRSLTL
jgi:hypothetical protein